MPCCEKDGVVYRGCQYGAGRRWWLLLTKLGGIEDVLVEDDCAATEGNPGAARRLVPAFECAVEVDIRNVYGGMEGGRFRRILERLWVHGG
jgi:hypothetical protein